MQDIKYECWIIRIDQHGQREFWRRCNECKEAKNLNEKIKGKKDWVEIPKDIKKKMNQKALGDFK